MSAALAGAGAGALLGLYKNQEAKKQAERDRRTQAQIAAYSPWTGMQAHSVSDPSMTGDVLQGTATGVGMGQGFDTAAANQAQADKYNQYLDANTAALQAKQQGSAEAMGAAPMPAGPRAQPWMQY